MNITLRRGTLKDAKQCGMICYSAFKGIAEQHNFPPDFPSPEIAITLLSEFLAHPKIYGIVAELDGQVVGSNFVDERSIIAGCSMRSSKEPPWWWNTEAVSQVTPHR